MAFERTEDKKGLSLPGLIDIIFLLLIFSLVTLSFSQAEVEANKRSERAVEFDLPETNVAQTKEAPELLNTLLFQIEHEDDEDASSPKVVYVLWPLYRDSVTITQAREQALQDSLFHVFPPDFLDLSDRAFRRTPPCSLIHWAIRSYKEEHFREPRNTNAIEIRAVKDTEFRIVNFIMEECSSYGDTIPRLTLRTLAGREVSGGF